MRSLKLTSRDLAIALSLANICYIRLWAELFCASSDEAYFINVGNADFIAAAINVLLLAAVFLLATVVARRMGRPGRIAIVAGFAGVLLSQVSGIGPELQPGFLAIIEWWRDGKHLQAIATVGAILTFFGTVAWWPRKALTLATGAVQLFAPFVAVTFGRAAWILMTVHPGQAFAAKAPPIDSPIPVVAGPRVVLLVFDALGRWHSIDARPDWVRLPEFDRLRSETIDATQVTQPSTKTKMSIPTLLSGLRVTDSNPANPNDLLLTIADGAGSRKELWTSVPSLLRDARAMGGMATVVGWYHPYCRMFPDLDGCASYPTRTVGSHGQDTDFLRTLLDQPVALLPFMNLKIRHIDVHERQRADALTAVRSGGKGLVFLHMMDPHMPFIWDSKSHSMTVTRFRLDGYFENMELMDLVIGELRHEMEAAGTWNDTAFILTSDHVMRHRPKRLHEPPDKRVPYILKMPGQTAGVVYDRPFNAIVTHDLVLALLRGELHTPEEATAWLDAHPSAIAAHVAPDESPSP